MIESPEERAGSFSMGFGLEGKDPSEKISSFEKSDFKPTSLTARNFTL
jgi:hypothetical protein